MITILLAIALVSLAVLGLALGVVLKKRTPLKGSCGSAGGDEAKGACDSCTCRRD